MSIVDIISKSQPVVEWIRQTETAKQQLVTGLTGSAKMLVMASLFQTKQNRTVIVTPNLYQASNLLDDLRNVIPEEQLHLFPVEEMTAIEMSYSSPESLAERVATLSFLASKRPGVIVVPLSGIRKIVPAPREWQGFVRELKVETEVELDSLLQELVLMGYQRQDMVGKPGEFSVRGSILDIYPLTTDYPVRIDFFDNEIDSIRYFEADTQRSIETINRVIISPATDVILNGESLKEAADRLEGHVMKHLVTLQNETDKQTFEKHFGGILSSWRSGHTTEYDRYYLDILYKKKHTILDYLTKEDDICIDDYPRLLDAEKEMLVEEGEWLTLKLAELKVFPEQKLGIELRQTLKAVKSSVSFFSLFQKGMGHLKFHALHHFQFRAMQQFFGQVDVLKVELARWEKRNDTVIFLASDEEKSRKLEELFIDHDLSAVVTQPDTILKGTTQIMIGDLQSGFELPEEKLVVVTEKEMLQTVTKKRARKQTISNAERLKSYNELKPGDFVVHINHGIGQYIGMETLQMDGVHQDYMTILYQNNDKLFIPVTQLDLIQKYVASESKAPKINKLGGSEWAKTRKKVSSKIEDIADDLILLYAAREAEKGYAFSPDDSYQKEFEDAFPYSETEDQLRSIQEIKRDMEKERPMDRLLVGDVGFGKTEVALRAAFKAVQDGKQVAFLVPTTILAQQHYETMLERFTNFPVRIGLLSRFRTKKQQTETMEELAKGQIDIVVGTHRILSKDVEMQDLGLLIVDEEQRFGVKHKERLKQLRSQVDVLTLTATPIPRTLHMSMLGVRDLSVLETPPANRYPVQTYVMEQNPGAIKDAVERELARGGQVFYLHNRVNTIDQKVDELRQLLPEARIAFAHGQMTEVQLENVLLEFINHEFDVLVTTTIIETGVDIANVNTLFVENADHMGLSTLYQLRGRVGRSNRVAFAYFMYEPDKVLNEVSEKRLQAIKDFTELGAGFKIAMRDLSIRGAGNLLGAQQHGFIDSVGFDMYTQMLSEAVARKQGKSEHDYKTSVEIDVDIDAYIPSDYIGDERQKIEIYKRVRQLENQEMYEELEDDLFDRFGNYPDEVGYLLSIGLIKMNGDYALIERISRSKNQLIVLLSPIGTKSYTIEQLLKALTATKLKADIGTKDDKMCLKLSLPKGMSEAVWLLELSQFVTALRQEKYLSKKAKQTDEGQ
ncbi:transcription-repair coupling factor [Vagococcus intermedius]|uniref:Transcription-repair-coupling factor n=1 Tax=Vagococcus intermedius TaxID=2991418 RepID=A0AAF0CUM7_9ENTE|nr:transcription-repair coupling factor [Vagococcus intermedius]WEG73269.1 transcription-repair coupling factor [Vagococcus intermedius]WEG75351.1 transcription-repair coupling factor [Vagococcus intermedius]